MAELYPEGKPMIQDDNISNHIAKRETQLHEEDSCITEHLIWLPKHSALNNIGHLLNSM